MEGEDHSVLFPEPQRLEGEELAGLIRYRMPDVIWALEQVADFEPDAERSSTQAEYVLDGMVWEAYCSLQEMVDAGAPFDEPDFEDLVVPDDLEGRGALFRELIGQALDCARDPARHRDIRTPFHAASHVLSRIAYDEPRLQAPADAELPEGGAAPSA